MSKAISGNRMMCGGSSGPLPASPPAAAIQPACRPITSSTNTLVEVRAIEATSSAASRVETATYLATEPKPGAAVGVRQVVVHGLRHADADDAVAQLLADLGHLEPVSIESLPPL